MTALGGGTVVVGFNYKYDSDNNVLVAEKLHDPGNSEVYTYQSDGQLASFARGTLDSDTKTYIATPTTTTGILQSQNWTLDGQGNWDQTQTTIGSTTNTETRTQSANNEIDTQTVNSGTPTGLTYDKNGNLTDDGVRKYVWDAFNRLVTVKTELGTVVACYFYDASGRRVRAVVTPAASMVMPSTAQQTSTTTARVSSRNTMPATPLRSSMCTATARTRSGRWTTGAAASRWRP